MQTKDDLVAYLTKGYIHVSRQDYSFFINLFKLAEEGKVTTGQNKLLDKLVDKYQKQLLKQGYDKDWLKSLHWHKELLETTDYYRNAHLSLVDKKLILKTPFSKSFITGLRAEKQNSFEWNKKYRQYESPAATIALKIILPLLYKNFDSVLLDKELQQITEELKQFENSIWNPTLVKINGTFFIIAANQQIAEQLNNYTLSDNPECVYHLSKLGINIHSSIGESEALNFAKAHMYEIDIDDIDSLISYLHSINEKFVYVDNQLKYTRGLYIELCDKLISNGIQIHKLHEQGIPKDISILLHFKGGYINSEINPSKIVSINNGRPVHIR